MNLSNNGSNNIDWSILAVTQVPREIVGFMNAVFEIREIRRKVGEHKGVEFSVRSNESNPVVPHMHAKYAEFEVSLSIADAMVLAGNLPMKQQKIAQEWVKEHRDELLGKWSTYAISATTMMTKSNLESSN